MIATNTRFLLCNGERLRTLGIALLLLRLVRDAEYNDMLRYSDMLDKYPDGKGYLILEDAYLYSTHAVSMLDSAIEDIDYAY